MEQLLQILPLGKSWTKKEGKGYHHSTHIWWSFLPSSWWHKEMQRLSLSNWLQGRLNKKVWILEAHLGEGLEPVELLLQDVQLWTKSEGEGCRDSTPIQWNILPSAWCNQELQWLPLPNQLHGKTPWKRESIAPKRNSQVSAWSGWSSCSKSCNWGGPGKSRRGRSVLTAPEHGGASCPVLDGTQSCNDFPCPKHCEVKKKWIPDKNAKYFQKVGAWSAWSSCSKSCESGQSQRERIVTSRPGHGGIPCPVLNGTRSCNDFPCPINCEVSQTSLQEKRKGILI